MKNIWIITDTHFGHDAMKLACGRPDNHEKRILKAIKKMVLTDDILIHLGDVAFTDADTWHKKLLSTHTYHNWMIIGNHDKGSINHYMKLGWDFVADQIGIERYGKKILLSHKPMELGSFDINIHGHFHNNPRERIEKFESDLLEIYEKPGHTLIKVEHDYNPYTLKNILRGRHRGTFK